MTQFWQPNPNLLYERGISGENSQLLIYNPNRHLPLASQRKELPIFSARNQILYAVEKYRTIILVGETGENNLVGSLKFLLFYFAF